MSGAAERATAGDGTGRTNRWAQLCLGIVCMVMIANMQYGWTLFVPPIDAKHHWGRTAIQVAFTLFVLMETWPLPLAGLLSDRVGPRRGSARGRR